MRTLILDQGYQPHLIVSWQRAICLLFDSKAEVLEQYDEIVRSVSLALNMPAVMRLTRASRRGKHRIRFSRGNVLARDGYACQYCGAGLAARDLTLDHVRPRSRGGRTAWDNVVAACRACNTHKRDRTPAEAGMRLRAKPERPAWLPPRGFRVDPSTPDPWRPWLTWAGAS
jgi:5-methylcytosine-specific restriction endonuclease McrA